MMEENDKAFLRESLQSDPEFGNFTSPQKLRHDTNSPAGSDQQNIQEFSRINQFSKFYIYLLTFFAGIGGFLFGYDTGVISGAILYIGYPPSEGGFGADDFMKELIVSGAIIGAIIGSIIGGTILEYLGRKLAILVASVIFTGGAILMAISPDVWTLIEGRIVVGIGIGMASMSVPVYVAEASSSDRRGSLVTFNVFMITTGQFISYLTDAALANVENQWRWMLGVAAIPSILQFIGMLFLPESPRWLLGRKREEEALRILEKLRESDEEIVEEIRTIKETIQAERGFHIFVLFSKGIRSALIVGIMLQILQQLCGINTVMYYGPSIVQMAGLGKQDNSTAIFFSSVIAFTNMLFTVVAIVFIDRIGRRTLLLVSLAGVFFSLILLGISFFLTQNYQDEIYGWFALISLVLYIVFFAPGMGPCPWTINSEIYSLEVRSAGNALASAANWISNLVISLTFLSVTNSSLTVGGTFLVIAAIALLSFAFVWFRVPETKGRTLEEISAVFSTRTC